MNHDAPELEQRLSELQAQVDRLSLSLHLWRQSGDHVQPMERRLSQLTERCAELLEAWKNTGERHAQAVAELESRLTALNSTEERLEQDASQRFENLGRLIEREWQALRQIHEEPIKLLREQAASLTEVCIATANTAQTGFDRAEARLVSLESEIHRRMTDLSRDVTSAMTELRVRNGSQPWALPEATSQPWSLEGVMRLHDQLRRGEETSESVAVETPEADSPQTDASRNGSAAGPARADAVPPSSRRPVLELPPAAAALSERVESIERSLADEKAEIHEIAEAAERNRRISQRWRTAAFMLTLGVIVAALLVWQLQRRSTAAAAKAAEAERQTRIATEAADLRVKETREEAARQIAEARETAVKARTIGDVLAAPDLVRYNMTGGNDTVRYSGQVLWSRSRGLVFSASRLPPPPFDSTYQIWLLTSADPVSAGVFAPDISGRASLATENPPRVARPVIGIRVTTEPPGGSEMPSGPTILIRAPLGE